MTGKAAETIAGLPLTSANYDSAWGLLEKQFGDKQRLIANFMNKLVKISSVAESRDVARLIGFLGQVEVIIRGCSHCQLTKVHLILFSFQSC